MFLVGKGIPEHITSLPQTVLNTPFGQMLKPQLDNAMRGITQAPVPPTNVPQPRTSSQPLTNGFASSSHSNGTLVREKEKIPGVVYKPTTIKQLDELLARAKSTCAVIFFTSATCPPCKIVYPAYDELAADAGDQAILIKVDLSESYEIGAKYQVRATPTFITFLRGEKENEWSGANESQLRGNVKLLLQMANPAHPHTFLRLPTLRRIQRPVIYQKVPPLEKLTTKMGPSGSDPAIDALKNFVAARHKSGAVDAPLPALPNIGKVMLDSVKSLPSEQLFPMIDLFRVALVDPRLSGYFAQDRAQTILPILSHVSNLGTGCPHPLRIVTLQLACNLFSSPLFPPKLLSDPNFSTLLCGIVSSSLLDTMQLTVRVSAASLAFNIAAANHSRRLSDQADLLPESSQVELLASLLEIVGQEKETKDVARGILLTIGLLKYMAPTGGEVDDLCEAVGAKDIVKDTKKTFGDLKELASEIELVM